MRWLQGAQLEGVAKGSWKQSDQMCDGTPIARRKGIRGLVCYDNNGSFLLGYERRDLLMQKLQIDQLR
jgi:hypothetical protein